VSGRWAFLKPVARKETLTIEYGYFSNQTNFDLDATYRSSMTVATAGFSFIGFRASVSTVKTRASFVVSQTTMNTVVDFNLSWTAYRTNLDGHYLYQWVWDVDFLPKPGFSSCGRVPTAIIGTAQIVQGDVMPRCLPGLNLDSQYTECMVLPPEPTQPTPAPLPSSCTSVGNLCCAIAVSGQWTLVKSIAGEETLTLGYGYFSNQSSYDLDAAYRASMKSAQAGFAFMGIGGGGYTSSTHASLVVSQTYINTVVDVNMTWTATWTNLDGHNLYQWVWDSDFSSPTAGKHSDCNQMPSAHIGTSHVVQSDVMPQCLPGFNLDAQYKDCMD